MLNFILPPIIGAAIGYITNDIAIRMLFHPRKAHYIGKWRIPFTPGLIPKEKDRIAQSIGNVVSTQLLNTDVVSDALTSDEMLEKLRNALFDFAEKNKTNEQTVGEVIKRLVPDEVLNDTSYDLKKTVSECVYKKLIELNLGEKLTAIVLTKAKERLSSSILGMFASMMDDSFIESLSGPAGELIDGLIKEHSKEVIDNVFDSEAEKIKSARICDLLDKYEDKLPQLIDMLVYSYKKIIKKNLSRIMENINLAGVVRERVESFDVVQLENMIFGIMRKELRAIVYLGALLGFILGCINIFI